MYWIMSVLYSLFFFSDPSKEIIWKAFTEIY